MLLDAELLGDELATLIKEHVDEAVKPFVEKIRTLELKLERVKDGKDADPEFIKTEIFKAIATLPVPLPGRDGVDGKDGVPGIDGESVDLTVLFAEVYASALRAVKELPKPKDGKDGRNGIDGNHGADGKDGANGSDGKDGSDGQDGNEGAAGSNGKDGKDGTDGDAGANGLPGHDGEDGKDGAPGENGLNGKNGADGINGRDGQDGAIGKEGPSGKDADPEVIHAAVAKAIALIPVPKDGKDGKNVDPQAVAKMIVSEVERAISSLPSPENGSDGKDGMDGRDGVNGFAIDDFDAEMKDERTIAFKLRSGNMEIVRELKLAIPRYVDVFESGRTYEQHDMVTYAGSMWLAREVTSESPGNSPSDWKLVVKRGKAAPEPMPDQNAS